MHAVKVNSVNTAQMAKLACVFPCSDMFDLAKYFFHTASLIKTITH